MAATPSSHGFSVKNGPLRASGRRNSSDFGNKIRALRWSDPGSSRGYRGGAERSRNVGVPESDGSPRKATLRDLCLLVFSQFLAYHLTD
jgi:hypothetical protein